MTNRLRSLQFLFDMAILMISRPKWFASVVCKSCCRIRSRGTAEYKYELKHIYHHKLDERLDRLPVNLGGATWVDYSKAFIVSRFCALLKPKRVLEIGTYKGGMTYHIARNTDIDCKIWTIDLPRKQLKSVVNGMIKSDVNLASMEESQVGEEWRNHTEATKIIQLWGDSLTFDFTPFAPFDLIYVDGSHAEPWVEKDTENAFKLLSSTGAILWDDCYWSDVQRVLGRYGKSRPIYFFEDGNTAGYLQRNEIPVTI